VFGRGGSPAHFARAQSKYACKSASDPRHDSMTCGSSGQGVSFAVAVYQPQMGLTGRMWLREKRLHVTK